MTRAMEHVVRYFEIQIPKKESVDLPNPRSPAADREDLSDDDDDDDGVDDVSVGTKGSRTRFSTSSNTIISSSTSNSTILPGTLPFLFLY